MIPSARLHALADERFKMLIAEPSPWVRSITYAELVKIIEAAVAINNETETK